MGVDITTVAAATAVVGYDLLQGTDVQSQGYDRALTGIGLTGSTAVGDCFADVFIDDVKICSITNTALTVGAPTDHIIKIEPRAIPSNSKLKVKVTDAANANPVFLYTDTERLE